jgi:hypothetical protein
MGKEAASLGYARRNIDAWIAEIDGEGLDAIVITASGCGSGSTTPDTVLVSKVTLTGDWRSAALASV